MIKMSVTADLKAVRDQLRKLERGLREQAIAAALNRTAEQAKTAATRDITSAYNLQSAYVRGRIRIRRVSARSGTLEVTLSAPGKRSSNLIRFAERKVTLAEGRRRTKQGTHGVYVKVRRKGQLILIKGGFIANQGRTVFHRIKGQYMKDRINRKGNSKHAQALEALTSIDVPQAMFSDVGVKNLKRAVDQIFPKRLAHEIQRLIKR